VRLPDPLVFFIDRCLGTGDVPAAVASGLLPTEIIHIHDNLFAQNSEDVPWLTLVGKNRWVGLTKDDAIRRRPLEKGALIAMNSAVFIFSNPNLKGATIGAGFKVALPRMRKSIKRFDTPIIGRVNQAGELSILWHSGNELERPIQIK
jgi:hypothetical protein